MWRVLSICFMVVLLGTACILPAHAAAVSPLETAITTASFTRFRSITATAIAALPGLTSTVSVTTFETLRAKPANALAISQVAFIDRYGITTLDTFARTSANKPFLRWLLSSTENLQLLLNGGEPRDNHAAEALGILQRIYTADTASRTGVLRKLAFAVALDHASPVDTGWYRIHSDGVAETIDPLSRYQNYKTARAAGKLDSGFDTLTIWQLRLVVDAWVRDVDLDWLRTTYAGPHSVVSERGETRTFTTTYTRSIISNAGYELEYNGENAAGTSVQAGALAYYGADADIERVLKVGGVCGAIAKYGVSVAQAYGIPAFPVGQPGHAAAVVNTALGAWSMHNDIFGLGHSTLHGGTTIPLMSELEGPYLDESNNLSTRNFAPAYILLFEQLNGARASTYARAEWLRLTARSMSNAAVRARLLALAVTVEPLDVLAWRDRIVLAQTSRTTTAQWGVYQRDIQAAFASQPRVLAELSGRIESAVLPSSSTEAQKQAYVSGLFSRYDAISNGTLQAAVRDVIVAAFPSWMRQYIPAPTVSLSFSGAKANQLSGYRTGMAFTFDNGAHWQSPSSEDFFFTPAQVAQLIANPVLYVRNRYSTATDIALAQRIALTVNAQQAPSLVADDQADTLTGLSSSMEYSFNNGKTWTTYDATKILDLTGNLTIAVRYRGTGSTLPSATSTFVYTLATDSAVGATASATTWYDGFAAAKAVDGDGGSYWLSNASVTPSGTPIRFVLDRGSSSTIDAVRLTWSSAVADWIGYGKAYTIAVADTSSEPATGSSDWHTVATVTNGNGGSDYLPFTATTARFVRLSVTESKGDTAGTWNWLSLSTFAIPGSTTAPLVTPTTSGRYLSDTQWSGESAYAVENGNDTTCDKYHDGARISLGGTTYQKGLGICYNMTLQYALTGDETLFHTVIGVDDLVGDSDTRTVQFEVIADSTTLYKSAVMTAASAPQTLDLAIPHASTLTIKYYSTDGSYPPSADWGDAYLR